MNTKALIEAEIEHLDGKQLHALYRMAQELAQSSKPTAEPSLMSKLKQVTIDAPEDFAANFDLYAAGEKHAR